VLAHPEMFYAQAYFIRANAAAREFFDGLSYSQKRWFTLGLAEAKKPETRARRIEKYIGMLAEGRAR